MEKYDLEKDEKDVEQDFGSTETFVGLEGDDAIGAAKLTRGLVSQTDDPLTPSLTFRVLFIGTIGATLLGFMNAVLSFRTNSTSIPTTAITIIAYPIGVFMAAVLPRGILNPGPFNLKEHALVTIFASAAGGVAYGIDNVACQYLPTLMNDHRINFWNSLAFVLTTQLIGYGLSGMTRRFLVRPSAMLWPSALPTIATLMGFHQTAEDKLQDTRYPLSRYKAFWIAFACLFVWTWVPNYFASSLAVISIGCLFSRNEVFKGWASGSSGIGLFTLTLDWSQFNTSALPMTTPWWSSVNYYAAAILGSWVILPILWATNPWHTPYIRQSMDDGPAVYSNGTAVYAINSQVLYDHNGTQIDTTSMYSLPNFDLNVTVYNQLAPIYISPYFVWSYAMSFLALSASISHVALWYSKDIYRQVKEMMAQQRGKEDDVHNRLMNAYPDIPEWIYLAFLGAMTVVQVFVLEYTPFYLPWWGSIFGLILPFIFLIPFGIIQGVSGFQMGLNVITEFIIGWIMPGKTVSVMIFKSYSYNILLQALSLTSDLKIGHYMHINPLHMVLVQFLGTLIGALTNTGGAFFFMNGNLVGTEEWQYRSYITFYSAGAIWGAIGVQRFWLAGSPYLSVMWSFPLGFILPALPWLANKVWPHNTWHLWNFPVMTSSAQILGPGFNQNFVVAPLIIAFFSQFYLYRYKYAFFSKYNYIISAGFDAGTGMTLFLMAVLSIFKALPPFQNWALNPATQPDYYCFDGTTYLTQPVAA